MHVMILVDGRGYQCAVLIMAHFGGGVDWFLGVHGGGVDWAGYKQLPIPCASEHA